MKRFITVSTILRFLTVIALIVAATNIQVFPFEAKSKDNDFFVLLRLLVCFASAYSIFVAVQTRVHGWAVVFGFLIVVFNPFVRLSVTRDAWIVIDVIASAALLVSCFFVREQRIAKV